MYVPGAKHFMYVSVTYIELHFDSFLGVFSTRIVCPLLYDLCRSEGTATNLAKAWCSTQPAYQ